MLVQMDWLSDETTSVVDSSVLISIFEPPHQLLHQRMISILEWKQHGSLRITLSDPPVSLQVRYLSS